MDLESVLPVPDIEWPQNSREQIDIIKRLQRLLGLITKKKILSLLVRHERTTSLALEDFSWMLSFTLV